MRPVRARLKAAIHGLSAGQAAVVLALGLVLGTFPVPVCPAVLCLAACLLLRLHPAPLQVINQLTTPVQLILLIPFARVGTWMLPGLSGWSGALAHVIAGWLLTSVPLGVALYFVLARALAGSGSWRFTRIPASIPGIS